MVRIAQARSPMNMIKYGLPDVVEESLFGCRQSEVVANESITRRRRLVLATLNDDWSSIVEWHCVPVNSGVQG